MGKRTTFLYLDEEAMIKAGVLDTAHCIDIEEELFGLLSKGDAVYQRYQCGDLPHDV